MFSTREAKRVEKRKLTFRHMITSLFVLNAHRWQYENTINELRMAFKVKRRPSERNSFNYKYYMSSNEGKTGAKLVQQSPADVR